jgi:hypothetical protein
MTIAVRIEVEANDDHNVVVYETNGNNKKRNRLATLTKADGAWSGHIWNGRDIVLQEEPVTK